MNWTVRLATAAVLCIAAKSVTAEGLLERPASFQQFVRPVLAKAGCNAGACHGYREGRGGFKLSLRGEDPQMDFQALVYEMAGRRINRNEPEHSLLLLKATGQVPHEGGQRFAVGSDLYKLLLGWLEAGAPSPQAGTPALLRLDVEPAEQVLFEPVTEMQLRATAHFDDGRKFNVTSLAVYEVANTKAQVSDSGLVTSTSPGETTILVRFLGAQQAVSLAFMPARSDFVWADPPAANYVDRHVFSKLRKLRINPSGLCEDHVFVRRAFLDVIGLLPTAEEARAFVADRRPDKRARLIDQLLARPEYGEHWALKWSDVLRNEEKTLDPTGVEVFHAWIRDSFNQGKPLDTFARELISSRGSTYKNPAANYWRALRDPLTRAETTARVMLGVRMQCAKCHNHPTDRWSQDDYYSWAAMFARIDYKIVENKRLDKFDKHEFQGEQIVLVKADGEVKNARSGANAIPQFLGGDAPAFKPESDRLEPTARWVTDAGNPWFARAQVNRIWYHVMGLGLVEPIDDQRATNPASNPPLLAALAEDFVASGYDPRHLIRRIMNSRTYQQSAEPNESNRNDEINFSHAMVRRLTAEQILDAQCKFLDVSAKFNGYPPGTRAGQLAGVRRVRRRSSSQTEDERFLMQFGKPERLLACECERSNATTLPHALVFVCGPQVSQRVEQKGNRIDRLLNSDAEDATIVDQLFWAAVSRPPSGEETKVIAEMVAKLGRKTAFTDVAWALMNSKEFIFRH